MGHAEEPVGGSPAERKSRGVAKPAGFTVVYGTVEDPAAALAQEGAGLVAAGNRLSPRLALIKPSDPPLRLNSRGWANLPPQTASALAGHEEMLRFCRKTLESRAPIFSRPIRYFLANYLDFIEAEVERERPVLEAKIVYAGFLPGDLLPTYRDWTFSALLPLPNAYVACSSDEDGEADVFVRFDALLWTGRQLLAILLEGLTMPAPSHTRALARLKAARPDLHIIRVPAALTRDQSAFAGSLGERLTGFWDGLALPFGPYRAAALAIDPVGSAA